MDWRVWRVEASGWKSTRCGGAWRRERVDRPTLPGSSTSIFSSLGVFSMSSSSSESSSPLNRSASRLLGGRKLSTVRFSRSPPLADTFSRISGGGGSRLWTVDISYALVHTSASVIRKVRRESLHTQGSCSRPSSPKTPGWLC